MITQAELHILFNYIDGKLIWKKSGKKRIIGDSLGSLGTHGYLECSINYKRYLVHRLIWLYHKGSMPGLYIDHINSNKLDNTIENLREANTFENSFNQSKRKAKCSSRFRGVSWCKKRVKWKSSIRYKYKNLHIGYFNDELEAAKAYNLEAIKHHGEFAKLNNLRG